MEEIQEEMFDDIPEDKKESFECPLCGGLVTLIFSTWQCDSCDFNKPTQEG